MVKNNTRVILVAAIFFMAAQLDAAPKITITAPTFVFSGNPGGLDAELNSLFDTATGTVFNAAMDQIDVQIKDQLGGTNDPELLAKGFGNANAYASQSATLQGYQGYKTFAVLGGFMLGSQLPTLDPNAMLSLSNQMSKNLDVYAGIAPSISLNLGINAGKFIGLKGLYVNVKYGSWSGDMPLSGASGNVGADTTNLGLGVNYQWLASRKSFLFGLAKWRGINLGTGLNYQKNALSVSSVLDQQTTPVSVALASQPGATIDGTMTTTPKVNMTIDMYTVSIPLEASTSVQFLWLLNLNLGAGCDIVFGRSDITVRSTNPFTVDGLTINTGSGPQVVHYTQTAGSVDASAGSVGIAPSLVRPRLMAGIGAQVGPVKFDIPVYYYFSSGFALGMSFGIVW